MSHDLNSNTKKNRLVKVINVTDAEAQALQVALADPAVLSLTIIIGLLKPFSKRTQENIVRFAREKFMELTEEEK